MRLPLAIAVTLGQCTPPSSPVYTPHDDTAIQLGFFYAEHGARQTQPPTTVAAVEALLYGQDDVEVGDYASARARIDGVFAAQPLSTLGWRTHAGRNGTNVGDPVAYYGLRMLDQIVDAGPLPVTDTLQLTAVVATCATVTRPTLPDLAPQTVQLDVHPAILADDARVLHEATALFRRWVLAITGGSELVLVVHEMNGCATVDYTDDGAVIVSYPDAGAMIASVPADLAEATDMWWVVAPSGVPGDGSGYGRHFITGGMGGYGAGLPLFLSDDAWFVRKPEHLGQGAYTDVERRVYQPQWFQHEFMHHLFRTWPAFGLEDASHQWFDRSTWPPDFVGIFEPDYYAEAIERRLSTATPTLAEALDRTVERLSGPEVFDLLPGQYTRQPVLNPWHQVTVTTSGLTGTWANAAGVSWSLELRGDALWAGDDCPYGASALVVEADNLGEVAAIWFNGERYGRD